MGKEQKGKRKEEKEEGKKIEIKIYFTTFVARAELVKIEKETSQQTSTEISYL